MDQQDVLWLNTVIVSESALQIAHAVWPVLFLLTALLVKQQQQQQQRFKSYC